MSVTRLCTECPLCGKPLRRRTGRTGDFLGCTGYPRCEFTEAIDLNLERLARELNAAKSDAEYLRGWADVVRARIRKATEGNRCPSCGDHLRELEALL